ncbi:trypsin-like peptidase domain-containing protein [Streptomyces misionensis]|uniref:nSTAND1 domain-containing NTPase n=1 Tax=Streptomyces misionensis TaxID=67331 RepID=UPI00164735A9|nr:trypsin-like peptidase domain-containing protein [Streptomyces misionensis]
MNSLAGSGEPAVLSGVFQVLAPDGGIAGAGFLTEGGTGFTCAHVVDAAGQHPGGQVEVLFPRLPDTPRVMAAVVAEQWRSPETQDVAVLRLRSLPPGAQGMPVGASAGSRGHRVFSYGFPSQAPPGGRFGYGEAGGLLPGGGATGRLLQLTKANDLTTGFSGGPVVDESTGLTIGMVTSIASPDRYLKGLGTAYATPAEVLRHIRPELTEDTACPYPGLEPFSDKQADWFHGREAAVERVLAALRGNRRLLMLLGPSGAGKSSLVNAGVLPALAKGGIPGSDRWLALRARPGQDLLTELENSGLPGTVTDGLTSAARARLDGEPDHDHLLLVIDQFEELLTQPAGSSQTHAEDRRLRAIDQLVELSRSHTAVTVLLVMRNDFYAPLSALAPGLMDVALPGLCNVPETLSRRDLQEIITQPAAAVGLPLAPDLADRIVDDILEIDPVARQAPVTLLPPLQLTMRQLWLRRDNDGLLTHEAYEQMGKVTGSLSHLCNHAFGQLPADQQPTARRILTALVRPADEAGGIPATRRRVPFTRLRALASGPGSPGSDTEGAFDGAIEALTRYRIITTGGATTPVGEPPGEPAAELVHDALVRGWADLRDWVAEDRQFHVWLQRATDQQASHAQSGLPGDLLSGSLLAEGEEWAGQRPLPEDINVLLETSRQYHRSQLRRTKRINVFLATALSLALIAAGVAFQQRQIVVDQRDRAASAQVAGTAESLRRTDPQLARRLAVASARLGDTPESRSALFTLSNQQEDGVLKLPGYVVSTSALDEAGHTLIAAGGTHVGIWNVDTRRQTGRYNARSKVRHVTLSADGRVAAVSTEDGKTRLLDATDARPLGTHTYPSSRGVYQPRVALSPHGTYLRAEGTDADAKPTMAIWDTRTAKKIITTTGGSFPVWETSFSPDERILSLPYPNGKGQPFTWYDTRTMKKIPVPDFKLGAKELPGPVVFSPDGKLAALSVNGGKVRVYHRAEGYWEADLTGGDDPAEYPLHFSQDGRYLAQGGVIWETAFGGQTKPLMHYSTTDSECYSDLLFTADDSELRCVGTDGAVRSLDITTVTKAPKGTGKLYLESAVSANRRTLALLNSSSIEIWSPLTHTKRATVPSPGPTAGKPTLSPDGRLLAVQSSIPEVEIWDLAEKKKLGTLPTPLDWKQSSGAMQEFAFSPDNRSFAAQVVMPDGTNALRFWDLTTMHRIRDIHAKLGYDGNGSAVFFDPSGTSVIAAPNFGRVAFPSGHIITKSAGNLQMNAISDDGSTVYSYPQEIQPYLRTLDARTLLPAGEDVRTGAVSTESGVTVAVSPDGRLFATVHQDPGGQAQITVWDSRTHSQLGPPFTGTPDPSGSVVAVVFTPDGSMLTSVDQAGRFLTHAVTPAKLIRNLCARSGSLTRQEWKAHIPDVPYRRTC